MTEQIEVIEIDGGQAEVIAIADLPGAGTQRTEVLDDLTDVDTSGATTGQALVKTDAGIWAPGSPDPTEWFSGDGPPPTVIPGARPGDLYYDRVSHALYRLV